MLSPVVESGLFGALFLLLFVLGLTNVRAFVWLAAFLTPLMTPRLTLAIGIDWHKVVGPLALLLAVLARRPRLELPELRSLKLWLLYASVVSVVWMFAEYTVLHRYWLAEAMGLGAAQSVYKMPVQLGTFALVVASAWLVPRSGVAHANAASDGLIWGCVASIAFGLVLVAVTGRGMLSQNEMQGIIEVGTVTVGRIGGLSGEPKMLGAVLVVTNLFLLCKIVFGPKYSRKQLVLLATCTVGLYATYSTSAWVAFALGVAVLGYTSLRELRSSRWHRFAAIALLGVAGALSTPTFRDAVEERLAGRLTGRTSEVERQKDNFLWPVLERDPIHGIWGFGFGGTDLEVIPFVPATERAYRRTPTAAVTGMRFLGDTGVLGVLGFLAVLWYWSRSMRARGSTDGAAFVLVGGIATMSCSINALPCFLVLAGAESAASTLKAKDAYG